MRWSVTGALAVLSMFKELRPWLSRPSAPTETLPFQGVFQLKNLVLFTKCSNLSNNLEVHMKNDWFLMIRYVIANLGDIKLCLMPCST